VCRFYANTFYVRDVSILGFWYLVGVTGTNPEWMEVEEDS
jgi:hypothetical protein